MNGFSSIEMNSLVVARRMMALAEQAELRRKDPHAATKNLKEIVDEDELLLSKGENEEVSTYSPAKAPIQDSTNISMRNLIARLAEAQNDPTVNAMVTIAESVEVKTEIKVEYRAMEPVEGLVKRNRNLAETDRYYLEFKNPTTFTITDKWSGRSTTIWGDPHVDTDDQEGNANGEFSDLKSSDSYTTMMLMDGTRVSFTAKDTGVIEAVDIFKGSQHLRGVGAASSSFSADTALFANPIDASQNSFVPLGDVVHAGGDGNDWYANGKLLWGKTTRPIIYARPPAMLSIEYRQEITQQSLISGVAHQG